MSSQPPRSPVVSIVLPTYNRAHLIGRSIRSLLAQTYGNFEVLVVDDASEDATEQVVRGFDDARIRYLRLSQNGGPAVACNHGIRHAHGSMLSFQGSDDEWESHKLDQQIGAFRKHPSSVGVVYCDMTRVFLDGSSEYHRSPQVARGIWINPTTRFYQTYKLGSQAALVRRDCLEAVNLFDERLRCYEDLELFLRLAQQFEFRHIPEPLVRYHQTAGQLTTSRPDALRGRRLLLRKHWAALLAEDARFVVKETARLAVGTLSALAKGTIGHALVLSI